MDLRQIARLAGLLASRCAWGRTRPDVVIDTLITPPQRRYSGHDDALRRQTAQRRARAETVKREGRRLETRDAGADRLHLVR